MIAPAKPGLRERDARASNERFLETLPVIRRYVRMAFRDRDPEARAEKVQETIANSFVAFRQSVPVEAFAYKSVLTALRAGCDSPDKIDAALRASMPGSRAKELSESYLASQRSGAISRMADLGLVEREREGVRVFYRATEAAQAFLEQYNSEVGVNQ